MKEIDIAFDDRRISIKSESNILDIERYFKSFQSLASWVKCTPHGINASEYEITYNKTLDKNTSPALNSNHIEEEVRRMIGVIYARYSSDNQREESIEGQLRECKAFAEKNDIQIMDTYIDRALSAKTDNRPEFQRMIKDSAKGKFEVVLVWKLDRFARNRYDSAHYKTLLRKNGVKVVSATENITQGAEGILLESMLEGMAEYYSAELSEKIKRGQTENALKCRYNGGVLPIGYTVDENRHFQIDHTTAPVVLDAFKHYAEGATMQEITDEMNLKGVRTKRGGKISINSVTRMLHNRKYIGEYQYRDIAYPNGIPTIVPEELFERVQERMAHTKKAPAKHKAEDEYLLTTKLYCGKCGCFMVGESGTSHMEDTFYR